MFAQISIHKPHPEASDKLVESMKRFGRALHGVPGFILAGTFKTDNGELIGVALWETQSACEAGRAAGRTAVANDPFHEWESTDIIGLAGPSVDVVRSQT